MHALGKLPTLLISVFAVLFVIIIADVLYFLWRRRRFQRRSFGVGEQGLPAELFYAPSKELLYFFCWKNQSRLQPDSAAPSDPGRNAEEVDKWQGLYGPSMILFTIREEDREGSDDTEQGRKTRPVSVSVPEVAVVIDEDEVTPFSTPCASPPYYTPSPSPTRDFPQGLGDKVHE